MASPGTEGKAKTLQLEGFSFVFLVFISIRGQEPS